MKTKHFAIAPMLLLFLGALGMAAPLTVSRISVAGTDATDPQLIRDAFLEVRVGDTLEETDLEAAAGLVRDRLMATGYFSSVDVLVIRSKAKPGTAALVAEVTEGFTGRYGGGPIWGRFGAVNLGGQGQDADLWLGWNRQAVGWSGRFAGVPGWTLGAEGGNRPLGWVDDQGTGHEDHSLGGSITAVKDWGWGWQTGGGIGADQVFESGYSSPEFRAWPRGWVGWNRGTSVKVEASALLLGSLVRLGADLRTSVPLAQRLKAAFRLAGVVQNGAYAPRDALVLSGLDGVRKTFDPSDRGRAVAWTSAELRCAVATWDLFGFTTLDFEPALIFDAGQAWAQGPSPLVWAAGGALRLVVGAPVFLPIRLEVTTDQQFRLRLGFGASAPF